MLEKLFGLKAHGTSIRTELVAGLTTFLTMAYIALVNPQLLAAAGMPMGATFVATCLAAAYGSAVMGLWANYPIALAPGMGINAFFAFTIVNQMGYSWQVALGAVFISGVLFTALSLLPVREAIFNAVPPALKSATAAGIGLFLALIGLQHAGIVADHPVTLVTMGDLTATPALLAIGGFLLMAALMARRVPGAVVIGIAVVSLAGHFLVPAPEAAPAAESAATFMALDIPGALQLGLVTIIFVLLFTDLFDTTGTLIGVAGGAGLLDKDGRLPRLRRALLADSTATMVGALLGTSTTTSYIESAAGTAAGGRTGLVAVTVAALFLLLLAFQPLLGLVPDYATAPALVLVGVLMLRTLADIEWSDLLDAAPAAAILVGIPFTFSIAAGIGFGFITHVVLRLLTGRWAEVNWVLAAVAALFCVKFAVG